MCSPAKTHGKHMDRPCICPYLPGQFAAPSAVERGGGAQSHRKRWEEGGNSPAKGVPEGGTLGQRAPTGIDRVTIGRTRIVPQPATAAKDHAMIGGQRTARPAVVE